jgi:hypothetical protein
VVVPRAINPSKRTRNGIVSSKNPANVRKTKFRPAVCTYPWFVTLDWIIVQRPEVLMKDSMTNLVVIVIAAKKVACR